jgi:hypothetical protein
MHFLYPAGYDDVLAGMARGSHETVGESWPRVRLAMKYKITEVTKTHTRAILRVCITDAENISISSRSVRAATDFSIRAQVRRGQWKPTKLLERATRFGASLNDSSGPFSVSWRFLCVCHMYNSGGGGAATANRLLRSNVSPSSYSTRLLTIHPPSQSTFAPLSVVSPSRPPSQLSPPLTGTMRR